MTKNSYHLQAGTAQDRAAIRNPYDIPHQTVHAMVEQWSQARIRTLLAMRSSSATLDCDDLFAELAYGTRIAQEITTGQWCAVADLLRSGAVESWTQIGTAMGTTDSEARNGFHTWLTGQVAILHRTGTFGITGAESAELTELARAVTQ